MCLKGQNMVGCSISFFLVKNIAVKITILFTQTCCGLISTGDLIIDCIVATRNMLVAAIFVIFWFGSCDIGEHFFQHQL